MTTAIPAPLSGALRSAWNRLVDPATWKATLYHLSDAAVAWVGGALVVVGLGASAVLAPFALVGVVLLAVLLSGLRVAARLERHRARMLLGVDVPPPRERAPSGGFVAWVRDSVLDPAAWRTVAYLVLRFPLGIAAAMATFSVWIYGIGLTTAFLWAGPAGGNRIRYDNRVQTVDTAAEWIGAFLLGLVLLFAAPFVVRVFAVLSGALVRGLLGPGPDARIEELEEQRSSAVRTVDLDRRRIEQDLHDGAQVRLTALAMQLGLAREAIAEELVPPRIAGLVADAHDQAKLALREIRDLARGIHPALLTDRGIEAALQSMLGRLPVPVELEVDVPDRPSPEIESVAFFVAAESVTNAVRHADSPSVAVRVTRFHDELVIEVRDRGRGGADPEVGTGLAGLRQRVEATGGRFSVQSPEGVGTLVRAVVPCGS